MSIADTVAQKIAQWASDDQFHHHHGTGPFSDADWIYLFDNHPYEDPEWRPREHQALIQALAAEGIDVVGRGTSDDGYTVALVLDFENSRFDDAADVEEFLHDRWLEVRVMNTMRANGEVPRFALIQGGKVASA